ncbi:MAG: antibiotic biosynthesis monooxygenase [Bacteroidaceae bacterium]|nr:antibiotic biosynthesis monooxygenase [Bacteroidaceae bacterium]
MMTASILGCQASAQQLVKAQGEHYTGDIYMMLVDETDKAATYHQELGKGAHNDWHIHPDALQTMFILEGTALYQEEGEPIQVLHKGEYISIAPNLKHWNGASLEEGCKLVTVTEKSEKGHIEWLGRVDESSFPTINADSMLVRISEITVFPEHFDEYIAAAATIGATSVAKEPGVVCIYPMMQKRDQHQIRILEIYKDMESYRSHIASEHFQTYKQGTLHMVKSLDLVDMTPMDEKGMRSIFTKMN